MTELVDTAARRAVLVPTASFVVQAPAGSGKTSLLTARFVALLARVTDPSHIVAITFTRKAAEEMRHRVLKALRGEETLEPLRSLALAANLHLQSLGVDLLSHPHRLRIQTFDAFALSLARALPVVQSGESGLPPGMSPADDAEALFQASARVVLQSADMRGPVSRRLLALDNDAEAFTDLLVSLIKQRELWLGFAVDPDSALAEVGRTAERGLVALMQSVTDGLSPLERAELVALAKVASGHLAEGKFEGLPTEQFPGLTAAALPAWQSLASWVLTKNDEPSFRARWTKTEGFPPAVAQARDRMVALCAELARRPQMAERLDELRAWPTDTSTEPTEALRDWLEIVMRAAGELSVESAARGECDFAAISLHIVGALKSHSEQLLMTVEQSVHHLLVDEFQDTSRLQFQMLTQLVADWREGDGRTVFFVGDPMQSIYRFRQAEVSLFAQVIRNGIAQLRPALQRLQVNFRSSAPLIHGFNQLFEPLFANGAIGYTQAAPPPGRELESDSEGDFNVALYADPIEEASAVVAQVRLWLADTAVRSIAILGRARNHLTATLWELRRANIDYTALEIDSLADALHVRDLVALIHSLAAPADTLNALAVLRAPWAGLSLPALTELSEQLATARGEADSDGVDDAARGDAWALWERHGNAWLVDYPDDAARLRGLLAAWLPVREQLGRRSLAALTQLAWQRLQGPRLYPKAHEVRDIETVLDVLRACEIGGALIDRADFERRLSTLKAEGASGARVQVMTLHKAKGLEFDAVALPGLNRGNGSGRNQPPLRWRRDGAGVWLAPRPPRGMRGLYNTLAARDTLDEHAETDRLMYVAATRAKRYLKLTGVAKPNKAGEPMWKRGGLLGRAHAHLAHIWATSQTSKRDIPAPDSSDSLYAQPAARWRLAEPLAANLDRASMNEINITATSGELGIDAAARPIQADRSMLRIPVRLTDRMLRGDEAASSGLAQRVGEIVHLWLAVCPLVRPGERLQLPSVEPALADARAAGYSSVDLNWLKTRLVDIREQRNQSQHLTQLLATSHRVVEREVERKAADVAYADSAISTRRRPDLVFQTESGVWWIVDYKTTEQRIDNEQAAEKEAAQHRGQLMEYAQLVAKSQSISVDAVKCAVYFPAGDWLQTIC